MIDSTDVFVSYQAADREWAEWIAHVLEDAGQHVKLQAWDVPAGTDFVRWMSKHLTEAKKTVAVYSDAYFTSRWCTDEWTAALQRQNLVPLRVTPVEPPLLLASLVYVDLFGVAEEVARERLLVAAGLRTVRRAAVGGFPGGRHEPANAEPTRPGPPDGVDVTLSAVYSFLRSPTSGTMVLATSPDGGHFGVVDNSLRTWLFATDRPERLAHLQMPSNLFEMGTPFLAFPSADLVVTGVGKTLRFFGVPTGELLHQVELTSSITGLAAARDAGWVAVSTEHRPGLFVLSTTTFATFTTPMMNQARDWAMGATGLGAVGASRDGSALFAAAGRTLQRWSLTAGTWGHRESGSGISRISASEKGDRFVTYSETDRPVGVCDLWTAADRKSIGHIDNRTFHVSIDVDPSGTVVAIGGEEGVRLVRHHDQKLLATVPERRAFVAFTKDGHQLITVDNHVFGAPKIRRHTLTYVYH